MKRVVTRGMKAMEKQAKREKKLAERRAKRAAKEGSKKEDNPSKIKELENLNQHKPFKIRFEQWKKLELWKQKLILRDKCVKFVKKELADRKTQTSGLKISKISVLISRIGKKPLEIENLCENLVSSSTGQEDIQASILRLKESMNFFYFKQLLDEVGISRATVFQFKEELNRMTRDYHGS